MHYLVSHTNQKFESHQLIYIALCFNMQKTQEYPRFIHSYTPQDRNGLGSAVGSASVS